MADESKEVIILELRVDEGGKPVNEEKKDVEALAGSIIGLQQANKKLREERNKLDTTTAAGAKRIKELNSEIDKNNKSIKDNSSALEKQRLNIGNYTGALDKLIPGLGATVQGIGAMTKAAWAFVANPIGAILAALALILAAVTSWFRNSGDGADAFAKMMAKASAIVDVLIDRVSSLVRGLIAFASGDFGKGAEEMGKAFGGLGDELEREIKLAGELADALDALEDREKKYEVTLSGVRNQIKELIIEAKNRTLTEEERIAKLEKASELEREINNELLEIRREGLRIAVQEAAMRANAVQAETESLEEFADRLMENEELQDEIRQKVRDAVIAQNEAMGESILLQEKIQNQKDALAQKEIENLQKIREQEEKNDKKRTEEAEKQRLARIAALEYKLKQENEQYKKELAAYEARKAKEEEITKRFNDRIAEETKVRMDKEAKDKAAAAAMEQKVEALKNEAISGGIEMITKEKTGARLVLSAIFKQDAIKEVVTNTYAAAIAAYKAMAGIPIVGPVLGAAAAGLVTAFGAKQLAGIVGIRFAEGGEVSGKRGTFNGPSHAGGGIDYISSDGRHRINVEGGENFYILKKSASREINRLSELNQRHGGNSWNGNRHPVSRFAQGGSVPVPASGGLTSVDVERIVRSTMENMPVSYISVEEFQTVEEKYNQTRAQAQIV
jgi:hypothetical protein